MTVQLRSKKIKKIADESLYFIHPGVILCFNALSGEMVEWSKAPHWKCGDGQLSEGSNPSLSAIFILNKNENGERRRKSSLHAFVPTKALHSKPKVFFTSSPNSREDLLVKTFHSANAPFRL